MPILKIALVILVLCVVSVTSLSCRSEVAVTEEQVVTVQRGDLTIDITAVGNLALSVKEDLAFEISGTVEEILVAEGDTVEEGQVLAKLDTSEWEEQLSALEDQVTAAERRSTTAERQSETKKRNVTAKELALRQAQINLQTAEDNMNKVEEVAETKQAVEDAEWDLRIAQAMWKQAGLSEMSQAELDFWMNQINYAQTRLAEAEQELKEILAGSSVKITTDVAIEVATKKLQVEQAQRQVEDAQVAIEDAQKDVEDAQMDVEDAQQDVKDAQEALDEALNTSPEIVASFDGFITKVNVDGGDEVKKGTVAVVIADPSKFEADILVGEMDIFNVRQGAQATIQMDALAGISLPAEVTHISPTATIQQGVVNYKVKVELQSLETIMQERQQAMPDISHGELPERISQAIEEGLITQEQAEEMMKQMQERQGGQQRQVFTAIPENLQLREGLTVTVRIVLEERKDVLLVPNVAITYQGNQTYVQVLEDGVIEQRLIKVGISDWQYTEVTDGLSEGEKMVVPQGAVTTPTTQQGQGGSGFRIPGMRGFGGGGGEH